MTACTLPGFRPPSLRILFDFLRRSFPAASGSSASARQLRAERLLADHGDRILRLAYSYLHNQADAEDIVQETLIRYLRSAPGFESPEHEKAWLLRVAANLSKNRLRDNRVRQADPLEESMAEAGREDLSYVWEAVRSLPTPYREAIHLYYYENLPTAQIARILCRRESTVRSDLHRGREKLREILREGYDFA